MPDRTDILSWLRITRSGEENLDTRPGPNRNGPTW